MSRKALVLCILLAMLLLFPVFVLAAAPYVDEIRDLWGKFDGSQVKLKWQYHVSTSFLMTGDYSHEPMKVIRKFEGREDVLAEIPLPEKAGYYEKEWTDSNPPKGKVQYIVSTKNKLGQGVSDDVIIDTSKGPKETDEGTQPIGEKPKAAAKADWPERLAAHLVAAPARWLLHFVGLYDPLELVYGDFIQKKEHLQSGEISGKEFYTEEKSYSGGNFRGVGPLPYFSTFTESEWHALTEFYRKMNEIVPIELVLVVVFMGIAYWYSSTRPEAKISFRECAAGLLVAMLLLRMGGMMFAFLFDLNKLIVAHFYSVAQDKIVPGESFLTSFISIQQDGYLGSAFLFIIGVFAVAVINWQYVMRKIMIALLIGVLPLVAVVSVLKRDCLGVWFRELISNIYLQAAHAGVLAFLITLANPGKSSVQQGAIIATPEFWFTLVALLSLPSIAGLMRRIIGAESGFGFGGAVIAGLGIGTLFALGRMLGGLKGIPKALQEAQTAAGAQAGGEFLQRAAVSGVKTAAAVAGGLAGGMIAGPAGMVVGGTLGAKGAGLFAETASSLASFASRAKSEGIIDALGMKDRVELLDPGSMYEAGQKVFGSNVLGKAAGTVLSAGSLAARPFFREEVSLLKGAQQEAKRASESLPELKRNLAELTSQKQMALARFDRAKSLYAPGSERMVEAKEIVDSCGGLEDARDLVQAYDRCLATEESTVKNLKKVLKEDPGNVRVREEFIAASQRLNDLVQEKDKVERVRAAVRHIDESVEYKEAKAELESISAREAEARMRVLEAQRAASREGLREYFQKLQASQNKV